MQVISVCVASCAGYADVAYYHAFEGGANGDQNSIGRGNVVAHGHSIGPCNVWRTDTPANSIAYVIASGCELWAYSDYDTSTATCSGTNTFYSGENPNQDQSTGRAIGASKCFIICCSDSHLGRGGGTRIQDGDIYDGETILQKDYVTVMVLILLHVCSADIGLLFSTSHSI